MLHQLKLGHMKVFVLLRIQMGPVAGSSMHVIIIVRIINFIIIVEWSVSEKETIAGDYDIRESK